jgi:PAS domain S-box-containing protein
MVAATSPELFIVHDGGEILYADEMFRTLIGAESGDGLIGTAVTELVTEQFREPLRSQIERIEAGESPALGLSVTLQPFTGRRREVIAVSSPIDWEGTTRVQTSFLTVADDELPGQTIRYSAMQEAPIGISISDPSQPDNPLIYVNDGFVKTTGYPRDEVLGRNCRFLQGEKTRPEPVDRIRAAIDAEEPVTAELRNYRKDGSMFWNRVSIVPVTSESGELSHFVGFQQDITDTNRRRPCSKNRPKSPIRRCSLPTTTAPSSTSTRRSSALLATLPPKQSGKHRAS